MFFPVFTLTPSHIASEAPVYRCFEGENKRQTPLSYNSGTNSAATLHLWCSIEILTAFDRNTDSV